MLEIARSLSVRERLDVLRTFRHDENGGQSSDSSAGARLDRWRGQTALDGSRPLRDPTVAHGCSDAELCAVLDEHLVATRVASDVPEWASEMNRAWRTGRHLPHGITASAVSDFNHAFLPLVKPFIAYSVACVSRVAAAISEEGTTPAPLYADVLTKSLQRLLENRLAAFVSRTAVLELHAASSVGELTGSTREARFASFIRSLDDPEYSGRILRRSPVLARLSYTICRSWIDSSSEFLERLASDRADLTAGFGLSPDDVAVGVAVMGDFHRRGRAVLRVEFSSGSRVIYKPRSIAVESQFQRVLELLTAVPSVLDARSPKTLARPTHGWVEHVATSECAEHELAQLYERYGVLLAVLHALGTTDCHFENIVIANAFPYIVDLEALFHAFPEAPLEELGPAERDAFEASTGSVLAVGILPNRKWSNALQRSIDVSGLGARPAEWERAQQCRWVDPFTDEAREVLAEPEPARTVESKGGARPDPLLHRTEDVARGFERAYRALASLRESILQSDGPLSGFDGLETRAILRPTGHYLYMLQSLSHPSFLYDGVALDQRLDRLIEVDDGKHVASPFAAAERRDLWQMDVPLFVTHPGTRDIWSHDGQLFLGFRSEAGLERARNRIAAMSEDDLEHQLWLIRLALAAWTLNQIGVHESDAKTSITIPRSCSTTPTECASVLAKRLHQVAFRRDGEATWLGLHYRPGDETWSVGAVGPSLFDGTGGIALFLAYLAESTRSELHLHFAREACGTFQRQLSRALSASTRTSLVGFSGIGGWIYVCSHLAALWKSERLLETAAALARRMDDALDVAPTVDVIGGAAGAIRPLLTLYEQTGDHGVLECARSCGDHIISACLPQQHGVGWRSPAGRLPLSGFAHGAAGISWALLRLYDATRDDRYRATALAGLAYERSLFSPSNDNWRDLRSVESHADEADAPCAPWWCSGSAGIGLARLDMLDIYSDDLMRTEVEVAVRATSARGLRDHCLCHGWGTAVELIVLAERAGFTVPPPPTSGPWTRAMLNGIRENGYTTGAPHGVEVPGLMMGIAGIGYALLRLADPDSIPSVALLEPPRYSSGS